jgi:LAS superfamily LD-carboxypeptidase LdcB
VVAKPDFRRLNVAHRYLASRTLTKWEKHLAALKEEDRLLVSYDLLLGELNVAERLLAQKIFSLNPKELGFTGSFQSLDPPVDLVRVPSGTYELPNGTGSTGIQYCPAQVYQDYLRMMEAMKADLGRVLYIDSAYRSPGRQAYLFLESLIKKHNFSLQETARWLALPGYSQHNHPLHPALDFINQDGISGDQEGQSPADFENLPEYRWLLKHAARFNFHLSYPRDNPWGVTFEPWHWHWQKGAQSTSAPPPKTGQ